MEEDRTSKSVLMMLNRSTLIIKERGVAGLLRKPVQEISRKDRYMLKGFSHQDTHLIGYLLGQEETLSEANEKRRVTPSNDIISQQFKYYTFLVSCYMTLVITAQTLAFRMLSIKGFSEPGGIFIFPLSYALGDVVAEVYGYNLSRRMLWATVFCQFFFTFSIFCIIRLPYPTHFKEADAFMKVFGNSHHVFLANIIAFYMGSLINARLIVKLKWQFHGTFFWLRSFLASSMGEAITTAMIATISFGLSLPLKEVGILFWHMYVFKVVYALLAMLPCTWLVTFLKRAENTDIYDSPEDVKKAESISTSNIIPFKSKFNET